MASHANTSRSAPAPADLIDLFAICMMAFVLPAMNGHPFRFSSGFFCLGALGILWVNGVLRRGIRFNIPPGAVPMVVAWGFWVLIATLSAAAHATLEPLSNWFWTYLLPFLMLIGLLGLRVGVSETRWIILSFAAGCLARFAFGGSVFLRSWGIPSLQNLLLAHFDLEKMSPYMEATFGNTSRSAALISSALVLLLLSPLTVRMNRFQAVFIWAAFSVLAVNALITGSRGLVLSTGLTLALASVRLSRRWGVPLLLILGSAFLMISRSVGLAIVNRFTNVATADIAVDSSLRERSLSIIGGFNTMLTNPLGVGPGMSYLHSYYTVAHQFAVYQGAELGVLGFLAVIALAIALLLRSLPTRYQPGRSGPLLFRLSAFNWMLFAMTANNPVGSGTTIPWIGFLVLFVAMGEMTVEAEAPAGLPTFRAVQRARGYSVSPPRRPLTQAAARPHPPVGRA